MQAITYAQPGGPEVLTLTEVPDPSAGPGEVVIATTAAGVNRADLLQRQGHYPPPPGASATIGLEVSGRISALGDGVQDWSVGDEVVALLAGGGYAEQVVVPAGQVLSRPEPLDLVAAGGIIEVAATVVSNLTAAELRAGQTLLVHGGAGGIGSFAIPYATALGVRVIATAGTGDKLDYCRSLGADLAVSYRDDWSDAVRDATDGRGVDVILDVVGGRYLEANVAALATNGRLMIIGMQGGARGTLDLGALMAKRGQVRATTLRARPVDEKAAICRQVSETVWPLLADGTITPALLQTYPLADAAEAHRRLESGQSHGKIVLVVDRADPAVG